jgi:vitamin B12/bleomycin/antimicrobial peptide transport system ATP-binding/permease protein
MERLPNSTLISVGHRPELEAFQERKLIMQVYPEGARLVRYRSGTEPSVGDH